MGLLFTAITYLSGYLFLVFVAVCLACGLYYLAELAEEYVGLTRRLISFAIVSVLVVHGLLFVMEPQLPPMAVAAGLLSHVSYAWLLQSFPGLRVVSGSFLVSFACMALSHYMWATYFFSHFHQVAHVLCFFLFNVWLVPFGFFVSLSVNQDTLPNRQAAEADEIYERTGQRTKQRSGVLAGFSFLKEKRDDMMPSMAKKV